MPALSPEGIPPAPGLAQRRVRALEGAGAVRSHGPQKFHQIWCDLVRFVTSLCEADRNNID
jgi:hypothetical protein